MGALQEKGSPGQPAIHQPCSLQEAWELRVALGSSALYISGGTLLRTQWDAGTVPIPDHLIDLRGIEGIREILVTELYLSLGALTPLSFCRKNNDLRGLAPAIQEAVRGIAAPSIRNLATIGGNIASGFGDILPALLVYDAEILTFDGKFFTVHSLTDWLNKRWFGGRSATDIIAEIRIPYPVEAPEEVSKIEVYHKIGRREAFTPSLVTVGITAEIDSLNRLRRVRIAAGGGSGRPQRLSTAESLLEGYIYEERLLPFVYEAAVNEFETYSDPFATEAYKKKTAGNLIVSEFWRFFNRRK